MPGLQNPRIIKTGNVALPVAAIIIILYYKTCGSSCSYLRGTLFGVDLAVVGILFMAALFVLNFTPTAGNHLRTMLLCGALGGETILVRFQIINDLYCRFCLAFGFIVLILFALNFKSMNRYPALASFLGGLVLFFFFFQGSVVMPLFS